MLLREAEHEGHPIPPPPAQYDDTESDDDVSSEEESDEEDEDDHRSHQEVDEGRTKQAAHKLSKVSGKAKNGTRAKVRRAWDKLGRTKEEVNLAI